MRCPTCDGSWRKGALWQPNIGMDCLDEWHLYEWDRMTIPESKAAKLLGRKLLGGNMRLLEAAKDALESLKRLPDVEGAYRVTCIAQLEKAIAECEANDEFPNFGKDLEVPRTKPPKNWKAYE